MLVSLFVVVTVVVVIVGGSSAGDGVPCIFQVTHLGSAVVFSSTIRLTEVLESRNQTQHNGLNNAVPKVASMPVCDGTCSALPIGWRCQRVSARSNLPNGRQAAQAWLPSYSAGIRASPTCAGGVDVWGW